MLRLLARITHDGQQIHIQLRQRLLQVPHRVVARHRDLLGQITGRHAVSPLEHLLQRRHQHRVHVNAIAQRQRYHAQPCQARGQSQPLPTQLSGSHGSRHHYAHTQQHFGKCPHAQRTAHAPPQVVLDHAPCAQSVHQHTGLLFSLHGLVELLGLLDLIARSLRAHRHVAHGLVTLHQGRHIGHHPVVGAVFAAVLHRCRPGNAFANGFPHVAVRLFRHVRVPHDVVGLPQQLFFGVATDLHKHGVAVQDAPLQVGGGNQSFPCRKGVLPGNNRQIDSHNTSSKNFAPCHQQRPDECLQGPRQRSRAVRRCRR